MQATYALEDRRVLGRAPRSGVLDLDPRTIMGVLLAASVVAFMSKSSRLSWASCWAWRCCRR